MPEVTVQRDTNVIIALDEQEASELLSILYAVNWNRCPWARDLKVALSVNDINESSDLSALLDTDIVLPAQAAL